mmetsp:Transcript_35264/g.77225  ORF Transcript_35264/g.77225 Transcript_35264/m.77225 type:complete len:437 (-) Transcript_35264:170-1480(-)
MAKKAAKKDNPPPSRSPASPKPKGRKRSRKAASDGGGDRKQKISKKVRKTNGDEALPVASPPPSSPPKQAAATTTAMVSTSKAASIGTVKMKAANNKVSDSNVQRQSISSAAAAFRARASKAAQDAVSAISNTRNTSTGIPASLPRKAAVKKGANSGKTKNNTPAKSANVSPYNKKRELLLKLVKIWAIASLLTSTALISLIYIGASHEHAAIESASSTQELYTRNTRVCGRERSTRSAGSSHHARFMTFASEKRARSYDYDADDHEGGGSTGRGVEIAHCGNCGECSNMDDMTILARTTQTLTDIARGCSVRGFVASFFLVKGIEVYRNVSEQCMHEKVGFTQPCLECWLDDMVCGIQRCMFTCIKSEYIDWDPKNHHDGRINRCYECDEKLCGPEFLKCSGTNRRRQGIRSDLARNDEMELCTSVDIDWNGMAA